MSDPTSGPQPKTLTGGCQCGAVRYEVTGLPLSLICCHCIECQLQSASAFGQSLYVATDDFHLTRGRTKTWQRPTDRDGTLACHFCADCGTRLYHQKVEAPERVSIKAGSLDERGTLRPAGHLWTRSAQAASVIPQDTLNYETQPADFDALTARWREQSRD